MNVRPARDKLWRTDVCPNGLTHAFFECADGIKLHYVTNRSPHWKFGNSNLVIFLHGFPDSWIMWRTFLASRNLSEHSTLVALDLPGYGGSDGLPDYGATSVLEAVTAFVLAMREQHFAESYDDAAERGRVLLVGHDWGALIAYRLAAEAPMLADRFIVSNSILVRSLTMMLCWFDMLSSGPAKPRKSQHRLPMVLRLPDASRLETQSEIHQARAYGRVKPCASFPANAQVRLRLCIQLSRAHCRLRWHLWRLPVFTHGARLRSWSKHLAG